MVDSNLVPVKDQELTINTIQALLGSPAFPDRYTDVPDVLATIMVGAELGLPPMTTLNELFVVNGVVGMEGKMMLAFIYRAGHKVHVRLSTEAAEVTAYRWEPRTGEFYEAGVFTFTKEDAIKAELWEKEAYQKYPTDMLGWKAVARAARFVYPDLVVGGYTPDDLGFDDVPLSDFPEGTEWVEDLHDATEETLDVDEVAEVLNAEIVNED